MASVNGSVDRTNILDVVESIHDMFKSITDVVDFNIVNINEVQLEEKDRIEQYQRMFERLENKGLRGKPTRKRPDRQDPTIKPHHLECIGNYNTPTLSTLTKRPGRPDQLKSRSKSPLSKTTFVRTDYSRSQSPVNFAAPMRTSPANRNEQRTVRSIDMMSQTPTRMPTDKFNDGLLPIVYKQCASRDGIVARIKLLVMQYEMLDDYVFYNMFVSSAARQISFNALENNCQGNIKPDMNLKTVEKTHSADVEDLMMTMAANHPDLQITTEISEQDAQTLEKAPDCNPRAVVMMGPNKLISFDFITNTWGKQPVCGQSDDIRPYMGCATTKSSDGCIFLVGGLDKEKSSNRIIRLDPKTMKQQFQAHMEKARRKARAVIWEDQIQVVGGQNNTALALSDCEVIPMHESESGLDRQSKPLPPMNQNRWQHSCAILTCAGVPFLYAFGGCDSAANYLDSIERLRLSPASSTQANAWETIGRRLPIPMSKIEILQTDSSRILLIGGCQQTNTNEKNLEKTTGQSSQVHRQHWEKDILDVNWIDIGVKRDHQDKIWVHNDKMQVLNDENGTRVFEQTKDKRDIDASMHQITSWKTSLTTETKKKTLENLVGFMIE